MEEETEGVLSALPTELLPERRPYWFARLCSAEKMLLNKGCRELGSWVKKAGGAVRAFGSGMAVAMDWRVPIRAGSEARPCSTCDRKVGLACRLLRKEE